MLYKRPTPSFLKKKSFNDGQVDLHTLTRQAQRYETSNVAVMMHNVLPVHLDFEVQTDLRAAFVWPR